MKCPDIRRLWSVLLCMAALVAAAPVAADVPVPTLTGPIPSVAPGDPSHDYPFFTPVENLADFKYQEEEYFVTGTASRYTTPALTTIGHPLIELGEMAAESLFTLIDGGEVAERDRTVPVSLVVRESCGSHARPHPTNTLEGLHA